MVDVAQSVEHQIVDLMVAGSSPVVHPVRNLSIESFQGRLVFITTHFFFWIDCLNF